MAAPSTLPSDRLTSIRKWTHVFSEYCERQGNALRTTQNNLSMDFMLHKWKV